MTTEKACRKNLLGFIAIGILGLALCGWGAFKYFNNADRKLARVGGLWTDGHKLEAIREYELLLRESPRTDRTSLLEMYASYYESHQDTGTEVLGVRSKALQLIDDLIKEEPQNALQGYLAARTSERLGNTNDALQMYAKIAPLLEKDLIAVRQGTPLADGTKIGLEGRESVIAAYEQALRATMKRVEEQNQEGQVRGQ